MTNPQMGQLTCTGTARLQVSRPSGACAGIDYQRYCWEPSEDLRERKLLPPGLDIPLACVTGPDGLRRWYHEGILKGDANAGSVVPYLAAGGLAILHREGFTDQQVFSYRAMLLLFNYRHRFQEHLKVQFSGWKSLQVSQDRGLPTRSPSVLSSVEKDLIPEKLFAIGTKTAEEKGGEGARQARIIAFGLYEVAKKNPLRCAPADVPRLVRQALFSVNLSDAQIAQVLDHPMVPRLLEAFKKHANDQQAAFDTWFRDVISHGFKDLARQSTAAGGVLDTEQAKTTILALVWRSYEYVAGCIHHQVAAIRNAIDPPLNTKEAILFDRMFLEQPVFAGLPWLLLAERAPALRPVLEQWVDDPAYCENDVLHRLLQIYAVMAYERHDDDQDRKRANSYQKTGVVFQSLDEERDSGEAFAEGPGFAVEADPSVLADGRRVAEKIAVRLVKSEQLTCPCGSNKLGYVGFDGDESEFIFTYRCGACGRDPTLRCDLHHARRIYADGSCDQ